MVWIYFIGLSIVTYIGISLFGKLTGGESQTALQAALNGFRPLPLAIILMANTIFAVAIFYGLQVTSAAVTIVLSIGVVTSFIFSVAFLGVYVTSIKLLGVLLIIAGIYLLR